MSVGQLETAVAALGDLVERLVFFGGATIELWLTDPAARAPRVTLDVDVIAEVTGLRQYEAFQAELREHGFTEDLDSGVMVRWRHRSGELIVDAVPLDGRLAGFSDRWLAPAMAAAIERELPSGARLRAMTPGWLIVTKLQAFRDRGEDDCLASRDFEDLVVLIDGRPELLDDVAGLPDDARAFTREQFVRVGALPTFAYGVEGAVGGADARSRADAVTLDRLRDLARTP